MKYNKHSYVGNTMNAYIFRSIIKPIGFVVVWFAILRLYGVGLGLGSPKPQPQPQLFCDDINSRIAIQQHIFNCILPNLHLG
jgi:hypothetical protein